MNVTGLSFLFLVLTLAIIELSYNVTWQVSFFPRDFMPVGAAGNMNKIWEEIET